MPETTFVLIDAKGDRFMYRTSLGIGTAISHHYAVSPDDCALIIAAFEGRIDND